MGLELKGEGGTHQTYRLRTGALARVCCCICWTGEKMVFKVEVMACAKAQGPEGNPQWFHDAQMLNTKNDGKR